MNIFRFHSIENRNNFVALQPLLPTTHPSNILSDVITHLGFASEKFSKSKPLVHTFSYRWTLNTYRIILLRNCSNWIVVQLSMPRISIAKIKYWTREIKLKGKFSFRIKNNLYEMNIFWMVIRWFGDSVLFLFCYFSHPVHIGFLLFEYFHRFLMVKSFKVFPFSWIISENSSLLTSLTHIHNESHPPTFRFHSCFDLMASGKLYIS